MGENLAPRTITRLLGEIRDLVKNPSDGIEYCDESDENTLNEIHAVISGPEETPFYGGKFRMKLVLSEDYPSSPPRGYFLTKIYHPNVAANGDICVNTLKKDWNSAVTIKHILQIIRCLLIVPFPESSLNDEAGKLFMESYEEFARRARIMTEVHAIPVTQSSNSKMGIDLGGGEGASHATEASALCSSSLSAASNGKDIAKKSKEKEMKKKSLKRL